ncbi:hypothetical protein BT96DRAFT_156369 [Gymnopus androsaceus JB14]|uniref:Uncharacterized protein n=1 Tax=Gymnopus androsaceus JB14 TaxID=1447944 RepID=A0A6A4HCG7_9AGAR|nr:hypothetical protein BT96DRAFT_156369 [Gymnopus androsaceus JB14]
MLPRMEGRNLLVVTGSIGFGPTLTDAQIEEYSTATVGFVGCPTSGMGIVFCTYEERRLSMEGEESIQ